MFTHILACRMANVPRAIHFVGEKHIQKGNKYRQEETLKTS